jgi:acetoin utilization protein AcuC
MRLSALALQDTSNIGSIFIYSEEMSRFDFGSDHPFKPERASKTYELCARYGVMNHPWIQEIEPPLLKNSLAGIFHDPDYLELLRKAGEGKFCPEMYSRGLGTADNPIISGIYDWSMHAAGGTLEAMKRIVEGSATVGFNSLGGFHHAMPERAEGFCYINDIVISIKEVLRGNPGLRIVFIDIDAHHGNGVQAAFYDDPEVLFISLHETGRTLYPSSGYEFEIGEGKGMGFTVNVPLEPWTDDEIYEFAFDEIVPPLIGSFSPDIIVAVLGADTLVSDPLTHLKLTNNGYQKAVRTIMGLCPRVLGLGGGGYDLYRSARCWTLAWAILNNLEPTDEYAGLVGGMMFGPEMEVGSLYDRPYSSTGNVKEKAFAQARRVVARIQEEVFPIHGIRV